MCEEGARYGKDVLDRNTALFYPEYKFFLDSDLVNRLSAGAPDDATNEVAALAVFENLKSINHLEASALYSMALMGVTYIKCYVFDCLMRADDITPRTPPETST